MAKKYRSRARRYYRKIVHRSKKMTIPIAPLAGIMGAPGVGYAVNAAIAGSYEEMFRNIKSLVGVDGNGRFDFNLLKINMTPIVAGLAVHKLVGGKLGVNRALAAAKIPYLRV